MEKVDQEAIKDFYNSVDDVWPHDNDWYSYTRKGIYKYVRKNCNPLNNSYILNAGSGGNDYGLKSDNIYHVDIAGDKIAHLKNAAVSSIEKMPFPDGMFDYSICVGSVINYCDAITAITEMSRVLKKNGILILEFNSSISFEYFGKEEYSKPVTIGNSIYIGQSHRFWIYSFDYIKKILKENSFNIQKYSGLHILSSWYYKKCNDENIAAKLAKFDCIFRCMPYFKKHANSLILLCKKI